MTPPICKEQHLASAFHEAFVHLRNGNKLHVKIGKDRQWNSGSLTEHTLQTFDDMDGKRKHLVQGDVIAFIEVQI